MKALLAILILASPVIAEPTERDRAAIALAQAQAEAEALARHRQQLQQAQQKMAKPTKIEDLPVIDFDLSALNRPAPAADPVAAWNAAPRNVGSCQCGQTGGCHCQPHSECAKGNCAQHNPFLAQPATLKYIRN